MCYKVFSTVRFVYQNYVYFNFDIQNTLLMELANYNFKLGKHKNKNVIWIAFPYNKDMQKQLQKQFPSVSYSASNACWYLPDLPVVRRELKIKEELPGKKLLDTIHHINKQAFIDYRNQLQIKSYSINTQRMYLAEFAELLYLINDYPI